MADIKTVAVIGAGVMGASIAAHCANAGVKVMLLDIVKPGAEDRSEIARGAIARLGKMDPAPLMGARAARLITPGNIEDDMGKLAEADWIVEAVIERLDVKQALYAKIAAVRKPGSVVSSNTSTIPLSELTAGMDDALKADFCITHFFNPPRYMRLLEIVGAKGAQFDALRRFADVKLGKTVVDCFDTPGFIANRIGTYWIQCAVVLAVELGLEVEEADAIMGKPMGFPSTGIFGLMDLVGIDLGPHVNASLARLLPASDPFHAMNRDTGMIEALIAQGYTGKKGKGGFYRSSRGADGKRVTTALDLAKVATGTLDWRPSERAKLPIVKDAQKDLKKLLDADSKYGKYAWGVLGRVLAYTASIATEIAGSIADIDAAMRLGYTWKFGPFELIDQLGAPYVASKLASLGIEVPALLTQIGDRTFYKPDAAGALTQFTADGSYAPIARAPGVLVLDNIKRAGKPVIGNKAASAWDIGDGVLCFEIHAMAPDHKPRNMLDGDVLGMLAKTLELVGKSYKALVLYNDVPREMPQKVNFSQGANLPAAYLAINIRLWGQIEKSIQQGQQLFKAMRYAKFPVVGAPVGLALGGGCEMLMHCAAVQAYAETYMGLVEVGVGLIPGWGGCATMLSRWQADKSMPKGPMPSASKVFETISTATVSKSAAEAMELKFLRDTDGVTMNRDRLLADAKARALAMAENYAPPEPPVLSLAGASARTAFAMAVDGFHKRGVATDHDVTVSAALGQVLSGGDVDFFDPVSEDDVMTLERTQFMALIKTKESHARIKSVIETGRPLRN
jgi:3-hydroxyacyl-CoA dehydrogenase